MPSFKNSKMLTRGHLITDPARQRWMDRAIQAIESQLRSAFLTNGGETPMEPCLHSLIAWSKQFDDSVHWLPDIRIKAVTVPKGDEGATMEIELL